MLRILHETLGNEALTKEQKTDLNKNLAHLNEKVITTHYIADTPKNRSKPFQATLATQAFIVLNQELTRNGKDYFASNECDPA